MTGPFWEEALGPRPQPRGSSLLRFRSRGIVVPGRRPHPHGSLGRCTEPCAPPTPVNLCWGRTVREM